MARAGEIVVAVLRVTVDCYAANYAEAREVAKAQHPNARILSVNAVFR